MTTWVIRCLAVFIAVSTAACASGSGEPRRAGADDVSVRGQRTYRLSCAACHGVDARGTGPVAPLLKVEVPDLTRIAVRREGRFPELEIFRIIDGQAELAGHGPRHMPVWGYEFFGDDSDDELAHRRASDKIDQLVAYLRSIQRND